MVVASQARSLTPLTLKADEHPAPYLGGALCSDFVNVTLENVWSQIQKQMTWRAIRVKGMCNGGI